MTNDPSHRHHMLACNVEKIQEAARREVASRGGRDIAVMALDITDPVAYSIALASEGGKADQLDASIKRCVSESMTPTWFAGGRRKNVARMLGANASKATDTMHALPPDHFWCVVVGAGGNSYCPMAFGGQP